MTTWFSGRPSLISLAQLVVCYYLMVRDEVTSRREPRLYSSGKLNGSSGADAFCADEVTDGILGWIVRSYPGGRVLWVDDQIGSIDAALTVLRGKGVAAWACAGFNGNGADAPGSLVDLMPDGPVGDSPEGQFDLAVLGRMFGDLPLAARRGFLHDVCERTEAVLVFPVRPGVDDELATLLAEKGFFGSLSGDSGELPVGTVVYRDLRLPPSLRSRGRALEEVVAELESQRDTANQHLEAAVAEHDRLAERFNALAREHESMAAVVDDQTAEIARQAADVARQAGELENLQLRRRAESAAAGAAARQVEREFTAVARELEVQRAVARAASGELEALRSTKLMRYSRRARGLYGRLLRLGREGRGSAQASTDAQPLTADDHSYTVWVQAFDTMDDDRRRRIAEKLARLGERPLISVLLPVYDTPEDYLRRAIESVRSQIYDNWELCIADDASHDPAVREVLEEYCGLDERIHVAWRAENGHIAAASNSALAMALGEWVVPLDHDDELTEHALAMAVLAMADHPGAGIVYSDEDKIDEAGRRLHPFFKPDFDPLLLLAQNYLCHMTVMRRDLVIRAGSYREGTEGSQDWDLVLRLTEILEPDQVVHVPHVLYHWRAHSASTAFELSTKPYALEAGYRAVSDHLKRSGKHAEMIVNGMTGLVRVKWRLPEPAPKVSIVIPTRDGAYLRRCIESICQVTAYTNYEVVVVDNGSISEPTLDFLRGSETWLKVIRDERPFNYSSLNNEAITHCSGEVICLLNDDCEVTHDGWLEEMVGQLLQDGIGAVGAKLFFPDGRLQHGGVILGVAGVANHAHRLSDRRDPGNFSRLHIAHSLSAVTAACMVVRRSVYEQVGGLDEVNLPVAFNDVDFCLRLGEAGWRVVWTPFAELTHHESVSRGADTGARAEGFAREVAYMHERWGDLLRRDPAYNPNLTLEHQDFGLAFPPRVEW